MNATEFLFASCQVGAENTLKAEFARQYPEFHLAFSRPGFVTFKLPSNHGLTDDFDLKAVFARAYGFSLGKVSGTTAERMASDVWALVGSTDIQHAHIWQRDEAMPGERGFEPGRSALADEVGQILVATREGSSESASPLLVNRVARSGARILDCVLVEPDQWWIGVHRAATMPSRWPGGTPKIELPPHAVSRAYWKMNEALLWSRLPVRPDDHCVEIGSAPGGSCQALLDRGLRVTGIDPAQMHEDVLAHPNFTHVRARGADLKRREYRGVRWLMADSNVAPKHTLDTVEHIVTHRQVQIRGLLLTLKLPQWSLADAIPEYLERVRSWGFQHVRARQLAFNRQEICVAALRNRAQRRPFSGRGRSTRQRPEGVEG